jgi:hypothetical protein
MITAVAGTAHHHCPVMARFERDPAAKRECRFDLDTIKRHTQIASREAVAMNISGHHCRPSQRVINFLPIDFLGVDGGTSDGHCGKNKKTENTHSSPPLFKLLRFFKQGC